MTNKEKYILAKRKYIIKNSAFAYKNNPETFTRAFIDIIKFPPIRSASNLETLIKDYLKYVGFQCSKITTSGRFIKGEKKIGMTSVFGKTQSQQGKYIPGGSTKGVSDLLSVIYGISLSIEIKYSRSDRQRDTQKKYQIAVESAGGFYIIVTDFDNFIEQFEAFLENPRVILMKQF